MTEHRTNEGLSLARTNSAVLVVAAWEPELEQLRSVALGRVTSVPVGIGVVEAALGTMQRLAEHVPRHVVLLGTCGASPASGIGIGDVIVGTRVRLVEPAVVEDRAAMPFGSEAMELATTIFGADVHESRAATIANTVGITTDDALAAKLGAYGDVEHLEAFGVARACERFGVLCTVILGVANIVGARGREQWRANHIMASARAAEVAWSTLKTLPQDGP